MSFFKKDNKQGPDGAERPDEIDDLLRAMFPKKEISRNYRKALIRHAEKLKRRMRLSGVFAGVIGLILVWKFGNGVVALGVFIMLYGNNCSERAQRM